MLCPKCGAEVSDGATLCENCDSSIPAPQKNTPQVIGVAAAALVVILLVLGLGTNWFGLAGESPRGAGGDLAAGQGSVSGTDESGTSGQGSEVDSRQASSDAGVKSSVEEYSWKELSQISNEIAAAEGEGAVIEVAKKYNLCTADGRLDGSQVKSLTLSDGTQAVVQIAGFAHDDATDGGKAGITFIFGDCIAEGPMNSGYTNVGGWEVSEMRAWLNGEGVSLLPDDLASVIVSVDKLTNNMGEAATLSSVSATSDRLWFFSAAELWGAADWFAEPEYNQIVDAEGSQYQLFKDASVDPSNSSSILIKYRDGSTRTWGTRTPRPSGQGSFFAVYYRGTPIGSNNSHYDIGVVPGFCI